MSSEPAVSFDTSKPNIARAYDFLLGGKDNFAVDRELAAKIMEVYPLTATLVRENRQFLARAVGYVARQGVAQFIDIGSGLPTARNTHEVAAEVDPDARVVYVDNDPVVISHASALLTADGHVAAVPGDLKDPEGVLAGAQQTGLIDLGQPVCLILGLILHFFDPADAAAIVAALARSVVPGSFVVISTGFNNDSPDLAGRMEDTYNAATMHQYNRGHIERYFAGLELVEPGLAEARSWHPGIARSQTETRSVDVLAGIARKPA